MAAMRWITSCGRRGSGRSRSTAIELRMAWRSYGRSRTGRAGVGWASSSDARTTTLGPPPHAAAATARARIHGRVIRVAAPEAGLNEYGRERTNAPRGAQRTPFSRLARLMAAGWALALSAPAAAQGGLQIPRPTGYINDFAGVIEPAYRDSIQRVIAEVRAKSGGETVDVTLPSLQGSPAEGIP